MLTCQKDVKVSRGLGATRLLPQDRAGAPRSAPLRGLRDSGRTVPGGRRPGRPELLPHAALAERLSCGRAAEGREARGSALGGRWCCCGDCLPHWRRAERRNVQLLTPAEAWERAPAAVPRPLPPPSSRRASAPPGSCSHPAREPGRGQAAGRGGRPGRRRQARRARELSRRFGAEALPGSPAGRELQGRPSRARRPARAAAAGATVLGARCVGA